MTTGMRWSVGESRGWSERGDVVEEDDRKWDVESEAEKKGKDWLERTERTQPEKDAPKRSGRNNKGLERGIGGREGLWGGALQGCETRMQSEQ
jgi:hypothetical protein